MHSHSPFYILHVLSLFMLVGTMFAALANPVPERKRIMMMCSGVASLFVMLSGFGMLGMLKFGWPGWVLVKIVCWLVLSALVAVPFRTAGKERALFGATVAVISLALVMVYLKPF